MSKLKLLLILSCFALSFFSACSKDENPLKEELETDPKTTIIIFGGKLKPNNKGLNDSIPAYWVDGVEKKLANFKINRLWGKSAAIAVSETGKIHFIASGWNDNGMISQYWIDGVEGPLPASIGHPASKYSYYRAATIQNEKFHLIGESANGQGYWIDGVLQSLAFDNGFFYDISTDGASVGIAAVTKLGLRVSIINGVSSPMPGRFTPWKIALSEGIVYTVGSELKNMFNLSLKYSVSDIEHNLPNSDNSYSSCALAISNSKVHIIAQLYNNGSVNRYWIDGIEQPLPKGATQLNDITAFEGKIYILGLVADKPTYWVDGVAYDLPAKMDYASKIIVVKK